MVRSESWIRPVGESPTRVIAGESGSRSGLSERSDGLNGASKSSLEGARPVDADPAEREFCSFVTVATREPDHSCHGEGHTRPMGVPEPFLDQGIGVNPWLDSFGGNLCARLSGRLRGKKCVILYSCSADHL